MNDKEIAHFGAKFLSSITGHDGRFKYRYNPERNVVHEGYNVLRHAGTIWSMLDVFSQTKDEQLLDAGKNAVTYLLNNYLQFFRTYNNACICEDNKVKLGGNALGIIALASLYKITNDEFLISVSKRLAHFMIAVREPDGDLIHKRYFRSGKISAFRSMYYTGEALLALLILHNITGDEKLLAVVVEIEQMLAPKNYGVEEHSHWMLYALAELSKIDNSEMYYTHAAAIAENILDYPDYLSWGRSTPIACRSEGLIAFVNMVRPDGVDDTILVEKCMEQIRHNLSCQKSYLLPDGAFIRGGADRRRHEVRIDYVQHNISSFLHFSELT